MNPKLLGVLVGVALVVILFCKAGSSKQVERFDNEAAQRYSQNGYEGAIGQYNQAREGSVKWGGKTEVIDKMKRWGIIIGINAYDDPSINGLQYAAPDARSIYEALTHPQTGGFKAAHLHLLTTGSENQPTRSNILESLSLLNQIIQTGDTVIFYFSGHGLTQNGVNYLLPSDTRQMLHPKQPFHFQRFIRRFRIQGNSSFSLMLSIVAGTAKARELTPSRRGSLKSGGTDNFDIV